MASGFDPNSAPVENVGGETLRRYRYQLSYAAVLALGMLQDEPGLDMLFCDHFDDVLLRRRDGQWCGVQVKTRQLADGPFKATEDRVVSAMKRFCPLDSATPNSFFRFVLASNCGYWAGDKTYQNLPLMIDDAKACLGNGGPPARLNAFLKRLGTGGDVSSEAILSVLRKLELPDHMPSLDDDLNRLVSHLSDLPDLRQLTWLDLRYVADALVGIMFSAASCRYSTGLDYVAFCDRPAEAAAAAAAQTKLITAQDLRSEIDRKAKVPALLRSRNPRLIPRPPSPNAILDLKLSRGGVSVENSDLLKDQKYSTECLLLEWLSRDEEDATRRYEHLSMLVRNECQEAYDEAKLLSPVFGEPMLNSVRQRLRAVAVTEPNLFQCSYQHLLGMAGVLTEDCTVWWSEKFALSSGETA